MAEAVEIAVREYDTKGTHIRINTAVGSNKQVLVCVEEVEEAAGIVLWMLA